MLGLIERQARQYAIQKHLNFSTLSDTSPVTMIRFPNDMLGTIPELWDPHKGRPPRSRAKKKFDLLGLPNDLLLSIFSYLDVFDSATLALTCKRLAGIASNYSQLDVPKDVIRKCAQRPFEEAHFLKKRLGDKFFSKHLRYCWGCKHYVPRRRSHWKRKIGKKGWEGWRQNLGQLTFEEWWSLPGIEQMLTNWNKGKALKCPRCKIFKQSS